MAKSVKGSKTAGNLMKAFAGESQARSRYTFYAAVARKEGYRQIEELFLETAENEKEHAKRFWTHLVNGLEGEMPYAGKVEAEYPVMVGTTAENLRASAGGENEEWTKLYPHFAEVAAEEGFPEVAAQFRSIAKVEAAHEKRFLKLAGNVEGGKVFSRSGKVMWKCRNCGHIHEGENAPDKCPACLHGKEHFELFVENY